MTYDELHQAFLAYRREHGMNAARALIAAHGGDVSLDSVPNERREALFEVFTSGDVACATAHATSKPKTLAEIAPAAWNRFRNPSRRNHD
jgi:hypothetical protein